MLPRDETLLVVDDEGHILSALQRLFRADGYNVLIATSAEDGLKMLSVNKVWLVIADNAMPGMTGIEFLKRIRISSPDTVRVMLTGHADLQSAIQSINQGEVYRYVTKPWDPDDLKLLVRQGLDHYRVVQENRRMQTLIEAQNAQLLHWNAMLQETVEMRTLEIVRKNEEAEEAHRRTERVLRNILEREVHAMGRLIETRDPYTAGHQRRVAQLIDAMAKVLELPEEQADGLHVSALLHDIGKIAVPAEILAKPGRLSFSERRIIKCHPAVAYEIVKEIDFPWPVAPAVLQHHERLDGSGYPSGLAGNDICLEARILAVADVVEAISGHRPYRPAFDISQALEEVSTKSGVLYDAHVVDACVELFTKRGFKFEEELWVSHGPDNPVGDVNVQRKWAS